MGALKPIAGIASILILSFGIALLPDVWKSIAVGSIVAVFAIWLIWAAISRYIEKSGDLKRARELTSKFLAGESNLAVDELQVLPPKKRKQLEADLQPYIQNRLAEKDLPDEDRKFYIEKLNIIDPAAARKIIEKIQSEIVDRISKKAESSTNGFDILEYIPEIISSNSAVTALYKGNAALLRNFYASITAAARPCIKTMADVLQDVMPYILFLRFCKLSGGMLIYDNMPDVVILSVGEAVVRENKVPIANMVRYTNNNFTSGAITYIYISPGEIIMASECDPVQTLILELIEELKSRLPEEDRKPDKQVVDAVSQKHQEQEAAYLDYVKMLEQRDAASKRIYDPYDADSLPPT